MENNPEEQQDNCTPEEAAAYLNDMTLEEFRKANATEERRLCLDSEGLGRWSDGRFTVGCVDEVNGPNSVEMPEFVPTRHELIQIAKYWATFLIDLNFDFFLYGQTGSSEWRRDAFAARRVRRIGNILGVEEINKVVDKACEEYGGKQDKRAWAIFVNGTPEEKEAFQDEIQRAICEQRVDHSLTDPEDDLV